MKDDQHNHLHIYKQNPVAANLFLPFPDDLSVKNHSHLSLFLSITYYIHKTTKNKQNRQKLSYLLSI